MTGLDQVLPSELLQMSRDYLEIHTFQSSEMFQRFDLPLAQLKEKASSSNASAAAATQENLL